MYVYEPRAYGRFASWGKEDGIVALWRIVRMAWPDIWMNLRAVYRHRGGQKEVIP